MPGRDIYTLDLNFMGFPGTIASYLIPHRSGAVLVECGPGSTTSALQAQLEEHNLSVKDISDVLLTHIHLDHAGAAGWLARQGARIHVHPVGAPHMMDPEKLLSSAQRIYGDMMDRLWGEFLPVPEEMIAIPEDERVLEIENLRFLPIDTPGHAEHHYVYMFEDVCFSGDIGGVRVSNLKHLRLPMPPPEFNLEKWRSSLAKLHKAFQAGEFSRIAPTHFGIYDDVKWHLKAIDKELEAVEAFIESTLPLAPDTDELNDRFLDWVEKRSRQDGLTDEQIEPYEIANPSWMSTYGIQRYWRKHRQEA
jgi:glyoxylase-like metal-dependent hydrolase (beta-lactamase superfamily II)